ncbi:MYCBP-associated protein [Centroberyx gerrardi]
MVQDSASKSTGKSPLRPLTSPEKMKLSKELSFSCVSDEQPQNSIFKGEDSQAPAIHSEDLKKLHVPKPPKDPQKPVLMTRVQTRKARTADEVRNAMRGAVACPVSLDTGSQPLDYTGEMWCFALIDKGPGGPRFDGHGMVLPHSILGSLEDFRSYQEVTGDTELVRRIPDSQRDHPSEASGGQHTGAGEEGLGVPPGHRDIQSNALQHWRTHMRQRRRQQDFLSNLLHRPAENLLMNQANRFRETQEQRELMNQVLPVLHSGYGYRVGSEFWSLPQRFGDELSGITATLTQTEQGKREAVVHVGQPHSICQESGNLCAETLHSATRTWEQSMYLQHQRQELREVLKDMDFNKPDIDGLEVIGSGKPFTSVTVYRSPLLEEEEEEKEQKKMKQENLDPLAQYDDVVLDALLIPALRFCGQPAHWTGSSTSYQGEVGISARINFEALTGERASSHLELHNEGSTALYYTWQQLPLPHSFPNLRSQTTTPHFYFNSSTGVILPGDTQQVEFVFKSEVPGIRSEVWQLNTHPVLLGGASMQVTLRGVALYQDKTADHKLYVQRELEKKVVVKVCRSMVYEVLRGVRTPERPSSPAELYITEEQEFLRKNPKLQYRCEPVEALKRLWQEVTPGHSWDLSGDTLRQVVLSLPDQESAQDSLTREQGLARLNSLLLQLSQPLLKHNPLTAATIGQQLWGKLLDRLASEAIWLRHLLGLPETDTWTEKTQEPLIPDHVLVENIKKDEKSEKKGGSPAKEEKSGDKKGESKSAMEKSVERGRRGEEVGKRPGGKQGKELATEPGLTDASPQSVDHQPPDDHSIKPEVMDRYRRRLHQEVYVLMEGLVETLCDLVDELKEGEGQEPEL